MISITENYDGKKHITEHFWIEFFCWFDIRSKILHIYISAALIFVILKLVIVSETGAFVWPVICDSTVIATQWQNNQQTAWKVNTITECSRGVVEKITRCLSQGSSLRLTVNISYILLFQNIRWTPDMLSSRNKENNTMNRMKIRAVVRGNACI